MLVSISATHIKVADTVDLVIEQALARQHGANAPPRGHSIPLSSVAFIQFQRLSSSASATYSITHLVDSDSRVQQTEFTTSPNELWTQLERLGLLHLLVGELASASSSPPKARKLTIVLNPYCGAGEETTRAALTDVVKPLLDASGVAYQVRETMAEGDGVRIGRELVRVGGGDVAVFGGDGTVGEVLNGYLLEGKGEEELRVVLLPFGTANAQYHTQFPPTSPPPSPAESSDDNATTTEPPPISTKYASLFSYLRSTLSSQSSSSGGKATPLPLALNKLHYGSPSSTDEPTSSTAPTSSSTPTPPILTSRPTHLVTTIVTSFALHASLLHVAESLRQQYPGVERFKAAAASEVNKWWEGELVLKGAKRWDVEAQKWVEGEGEGEGGVVRKDGTWSYGVAGLVDRFEEKFAITALRNRKETKAEELAGTLDLVLLQPLLHAETAHAWGKAEQEEQKEEVKKGYAGSVWGVMGGAYAEGAHVKSGSGFKDIGGSYWRVEGIEWHPAKGPENDTPFLVCLDGRIIDVGEGGWVETLALSTDGAGSADVVGGARVAVWV
ncbi:hypothetical protein MNV49_006255 [Pseudohyphozyma bogoriensis]|nr:hypothetical protein MNV49_006255 [Pseudohyphozyma bogoriensis]